MKPVLTAEQADKVNKQTIYPCPIFMNKVNHVLNGDDKKQVRKGQNTLHCI